MKNQTKITLNCVTWETPTAPDAPIGAARFTISHEIVGPFSLTIPIPQGVSESDTVKWAKNTLDQALKEMAAGATHSA
ncbi:MAG: hypothetical protein WDN44_11900 [Sphingomonas sp.]